jgi:2-haloacid dehalogenase
LPFDPSVAEDIYRRVPDWGPHPDVVKGLKSIAGVVPLVILSNTMNELIPHNVEKLEVPFAHVFTAEDAQAYKPRMQAFEHMLDGLGCRPEDIMHVSCHYRYDLMTAYDMGFGRRVFVNRGFEFPAHGYATDVIDDIGGLAALLGL